MACINKTTNIRNLTKYQGSQDIYYTNDTVREELELDINTIEPKKLDKTWLSFIDATDDLIFGNGQSHIFYVDGKEMTINTCQEMIENIAKRKYNQVSKVNVKQYASGMIAVELSAGDEWSQTKNFLPMKYSKLELAYVQADINEFKALWNNRVPFSQKSEEMSKVIYRMYEQLGIKFPKKDRRYLTSEKEMWKLIEHTIAKQYSDLIFVNGWDEALNSAYYFPVRKMTRLETPTIARSKANRAKKLGRIPEFLKRLIP